MPLERLSPVQLKELLARGEALVLLDVREPSELAVCALPGSLHIPMRDVPRRRDELDPQAAIVCICHHGMRSAQVASWLAAQGYERVYNLTGGVDAWAEEVEPSMARY